MRALILAMAWLLVPAVAMAQANGPKIFISFDMEGLAGAVTSSQLAPGGFEYETYRDLGTLEAKAAIEAAFEAGASEVVVADSHGDGENLKIEDLPANVQVIRGWPRPFDMMAGIDASFDGVVMIGYHTGTANPQGVRAHSFSSAYLSAVRLNGVDMSEASFNAAIAGHFGVPVIMISGDDASVAEARQVLGDVEGAVVKWSHGFHAARTLHPEAARRLIANKVAKAVGRIDAFEPYRLSGPVTLEVRFKNYRPAEILAYLSAVLPGLERSDAHTIRFEGEDMEQVARFFDFIMAYDLGLSP